MSDDFPSPYFVSFKWIAELRVIKNSICRVGRILSLVKCYVFVFFIVAAAAAHDNYIE